MKSCQNIENNASENVAHFELYSCSWKYGEDGAH